MFSYNKKISAAYLGKELEIVIFEIQKLNLPKSFSQYVLYILSELSDNITEHSFAKNVKFEIDIKDMHFKMVVIDDGIGLKQSYANKKIISKNDQSAIELALGGLSTKDFKERGFGLYSIRRLTLALEGRFTISSGNVKAKVEKN